MKARWSNWSRPAHDTLSDPLNLMSVSIVTQLHLVPQIRTTMHLNRLRDLMDIPLNVLKY